ncbi:hypothetical protein M446_5466 [Methylobacterium sp. 4-46]|uniref:hypothetical protein n=1 Tax=unclassified Methylobacterium TaxID=2615210 RepID=UPI000165CD5F|nr:MULTISPECIES: hypothetical protein [Methylobacterium]ACA19782.1 hypothetical protein M446_5466 [Methylobacterium sp. 4-46]WFT78969.1 hypothetical protein QA634_27530 [Methylobacterium nodulans]
MGVARLILLGAMLAAGIVVMANGHGPRPAALSHAAPAPAAPDACAGAAWPYRPAACTGTAPRPAVRVIGAAPLRLAER